MEPVPLVDTRRHLRRLLWAGPSEWGVLPSPAPCRHPALCLQREGELGEPCTLVFRSCRPGAPSPREPLGGLPAAARACGLSLPPPPAARPRSLPPAQPAGARTPGLRHVGAREAAAAAAAAGAQARAGEIALHAAGSAAAFRSASGPSPDGRADEAAEGKRTRPGGGVRRAGASWALSKGRPQLGGDYPALLLSLRSSRCRGSRQRDAAALLGSGQGRLPVAAWPTLALIPRASPLSVPTHPAAGAQASTKSEVCPQRRRQLPWEPLSPQPPVPALGAMRPQPGSAPSASSPPMGSTALGCPAWSA